MTAAVRTGWLADIRAHGVLDVGLAFGLEYEDRGTGRLSPCPRCAADKRHPKRNDRRPAIGLRPDDAGWQCFACDITGDAVTLAALVALEGRVPAGGDTDGWRKVRAASASVGLCAPDPHDSTAPRVPFRPVPVRRPPAPPLRPPAGEVAAVWAACVPVTDDAEVAGYLRLRRIPDDRVEERDLARALPVGAETPSWATAWAKRGYRLLVPIFALRGNLTSLRARSVRLPAPELKTIVPAGFAAGGLVLAEVLARRVLAGDDDAAELVVKAGLWIAEGEIDLLHLATLWGDCDIGPAVIGVASGAWTPEHGRLVPPGTLVTIATDSDDQGDEYAAGIVATLPPTVRWRRWRAGR